MKSLTELLAQRQTLDAEIGALQKAGRQQAIAAVMKLMQENGLTVYDVGAPRATAGRGKKQDLPSASKKLPAKYRDSHGNTWTGRGLHPRWLKAALAAGAKLADFAL